MKKVNNLINYNNFKKIKLKSSNFYIKKIKIKFYFFG